MDNIPAWARNEINLLKPKDCAATIERWSEIKRDVLPHLESLADAQKGYVLRIAMGNYSDYGGEITKEVRQQLRRLKEVNEGIRKHAKAMAKLLRTRKEIKEKAHVSDRQPDLWELIEASAKNYPVWEHVAHDKMQDFYIKRQEFLRIATDQSAQGPDLEDVLDGWEEYWGEEYSLGSALHTRQAGPSDYVRLILAKLEKYKRAAIIPSSFDLPDSALATLVNVVFNLSAEGALTEDAVRKNRARWSESNKWRL